MRRLLGSAVTCLAMTLLALPTPAFADSGPSVGTGAKPPVVAPASHQFSTSTPHCSAKLSAMSMTDVRKAETAKAKTPAPTLDCFATQQQVVAYVTSNAQVASLSAPAIDSYLTQLAASGVSGPSTALNNTGGNFLLGIDSWDANYKGASLSWYGDSKCSASFGYYTNYVGATWNDKISSAVNYAYSGCGNWDHFPELNLGGNSAYGGFRNCGYAYNGGTNCFSTMGLMNDRTTSERWSLG